MIYSFIYKLSTYWYDCFSIKILKLASSSFFVIIQSRMLIDNIFWDWIIPFPLQIGCLSLLLGHQAHFEVFILDHCPLLILLTHHQGSNQIHFLVYFVSLFMEHVLVEGIFELYCSLPTMPCWEAAPYNGISFPI